MEVPKHLIIRKRPVWKKPSLVAGITGSIGAGKSTFSSALKRHGVYILDADQLAHRVLHSPRMEGPLLQLLGDGVLENGSLSRKRIGGIVFHREDLRRRLNEMIHPVVREEFHEAVAQLKEGEILFYDVPLLFETGLNQDLDLTVTVVADDQDRQKRVLKRDGISREEFERRDGAQMNQKQKQELSDIIIRNDGRPESLKLLADALIQLLHESREQ